jgi:hypothetical protein
MHAGVRIFALQPTQLILDQLADEFAQCTGHRPEK